MTLGPTTNRAPSWDTFRYIYIYIYKYIYIYILGSIYTYIWKGSCLVPRHGLMCPFTLTPYGGPDGTGMNISAKLLNARRGIRMAFAISGTHDLDLEILDSRHGLG